MSEFFAYVHCDKNLVPFYVGRGTYHRATTKSKRSESYNAKKSEIGAKNIQIGYMECSTLEASCELEAGLIKCLTRMGVELTNRAKGGLGGGSFERTAEQNIAMSEATKGKVNSEETKRKMALGKMGNQWNVGKKYDDERRIVMSRARGGQPVRCEKDGEVRIYPTINDAAKGIGYDSGNLSRALRGMAAKRGKGCNGWQVSFVDITDA